MIPDHTKIYGMHDQILEILFLVIEVLQSLLELKSDSNPIKFSVCQIAGIWVLT